MIFDTHAHYDDKQFEADRSGLLSSMEENGIGLIVNIGADLKSSETTIELAGAYDFVYGAVGVHPSDIDCLSEEGMEWLKNAAANEKVVAIGEIGLDYYWDKESQVQNQQRYWFRRQLKLARELSLPVVIHSRDAAADTLEIMKEHTKELGSENQGKGVIHCFSYSKEIALEYIKMGYYIGVGGVVTFKNAKKLKEVVEAIPLEQIVIETDCPYLAPEPNRGKRNSSLNLPYVMEEIAKIKGITALEVEEATYRNGKKVYKIEREQRWQP